MGDSLIARGAGASGALVVHSGGPTAVINASLAGIIEEAAAHPGFGPIAGARHGFDGLLAEDIVDLSGLTGTALEAIAAAPSSALGSSRRALSDVDVDRALDICRSRGVRTLLLTGGNGSMAAAHAIARRARAGQPLALIGVPKTIDNDLAGTDHAPGYGSAARFAACAARDIGADNRALPHQVQVLEVLGRHAGWIAAATALAKRSEHDPPHLVYVPEQPLPLPRLLDDVQRTYDVLSRCLVVVCEGQLDAHGEPFGADVRPTSAGPLAMNLAHHLASLITRHLGLKARGEKPGLLGRASAEMRSSVDWREARECGRAAVRAAVAGASDVMITIERTPGATYSATTGIVALDRVAGVERRLPAAWVKDQQLDLGAINEYAAPLVGQIPPNPSL